jgi:hypothetical protein
MISSNFNYFLNNYRDSGYFLKFKSIYNEAFLFITRVLSFTGSKIRKFNIKSNYNNDKDSQNVDGTIFREISYMNLSYYCDTFRDFREITITAYEYDVDDWIIDNLTKILSCATDLKSL